MKTQIEQIEDLIMRKAYGDTLSVLLEGSKSVHCSLRLGERIKADSSNYINLSVRFDQGPAATICGYPNEYLIHDVNVDYFDSESPLGEEVFMDFAEGAFGDRFTQYISAEDEARFLEGVVRGIKRQAKDPMFKDRCSTEFREKCISMINLKIKELRGAK